MLVIKLRFAWQAITAAPLAFNLFLGTSDTWTIFLAWYRQLDLETLHGDWKLVKGVLRGLSLSLQWKGRLWKLFCRESCAPCGLVESLGRPSCRSDTDGIDRFHIIHSCFLCTKCESLVCEQPLSSEFIPTILEIPE